MDLNNVIYKYSHGCYPASSWNKFSISADNTPMKGMDLNVWAMGLFDEYRNVWRAAILVFIFIMLSGCSGGGAPDSSTTSSPPTTSSPTSSLPNEGLTVQADDIGRYWTRLEGSGLISDVEAIVWFEYKASSLSGWDEGDKTDVAGKTREQSATDLSSIDGWLYGLKPNTEYDVRVCARDPADDVKCYEPSSFTTLPPSTLQRVMIDPASPEHLMLEGGKRFVPWGNNYVHVDKTNLVNQLVEDQMYTAEGLARIDADLERLENLAAPNPDGRSNVVRMHLQLHTFLLDPTTPDREALARFGHVIELAEDHGLHVMVTGLNYFYPADNPFWVARQTKEEKHWATQALWWRSMAAALKHSPGVFAYDLMNEPTVGNNRVRGELVRWNGASPTGYCSYGAEPSRGKHGVCYVQFITPNPGGRSRKQVAAEWTRRMVRYIHGVDTRHLVTVSGRGSPGLESAFNSSAGVHASLDFLSPHLYPNKEDPTAIELAAALDSLTTKPIIVGETFAFGDLKSLITQACNDGMVQGWFGQYNGRVLGDDRCQSLNCAFYDNWYKLQRDLGPPIRAGDCPAQGP